jgi:uncharacterized membrane protein
MRLTLHGAIEFAAILSGTFPLNVEVAVKKNTMSTPWEGRSGQAAKAKQSRAKLSNAMDLQHCQGLNGGTYTLLPMMEVAEKYRTARIVLDGDVDAG